MNLTNMPPAVILVLRRRRHTDAAIEAMTPEEAFCEYCQYHGMLNMRPTTISILDHLRSVDLEKSK